MYILAMCGMTTVSDLYNTVWGFWGFGGMLESGVYSNSMWQFQYDSYPCESDAQWQEIHCNGYVSLLFISRSLIE